MVVRGRFSRKAPPPKIVIPKLYNTFISNIAALKRKPNEQEALNILYDIANVVTPIMKEYGFKVRNLCEFSPKTDNLLGMNVNHGYKIFIRLRPPHNDNVFYPMNELIGTMLHELTHNKHGPHDSKFYKLLDELTTKQELIIAKGGPVFEQEPFQGLGNKLGGKEITNIRDSRLKRLDIKYHGGVEKLGGKAVSGKKGDLKDLVRDAAMKRFEDNKWCHDAQKGDLPGDDELDIIEIDSETEEEEEEIKLAKKNPDSVERKRALDSIDKDKSLKKNKKQDHVIVLDESEDEAKSTTPNLEFIDLTED